MILVLVRHAKAVDGNALIADADRQLTESGRAKFMKAACGIALLVPVTSQILTSPKARALQTAELLATALNLSMIEQSPILTSGDLPSFLDQYSDQAQCIIAVGHEPYLSKWIRLITGSDTSPLCKGGMAFLETYNNQSGRLLCVLSPQRAGVLAAGNLQYPFEQFSLALKLRVAIISGQGTSEDIHQLRVQLRRVRYIMYCMKPLLPKRSASTVMKNINHIIESADCLRETAVLQNLLHDAGIQPAGLVELLNKKNKTETTAFMEAITSISCYLSIADTLGMLNRIQKLKNYETSLIKKYSKLVRKIYMSLNDVEPDNQISLHQLRVQCRKLRDILSIFTELQGIAGRKLFQAADKLQSCLGLEHDVYISRLLLEEIKTTYKDVIQSDILEAAESQFASLHKDLPIKSALKDLKKILRDTRSKK